MDTIIKELPIPKEVIEVQEALPLPQPEPNGYGKDVGILVAGVIAAAVLYNSLCCRYFCSSSSLRF